MRDTFNDALSVPPGSVPVINKLLVLRLDMQRRRAFDGCQRRVRDVLSNVHGISMWDQGQDVPIERELRTAGVILDNRSNGPEGRQVGDREEG